MSNQMKIVVDARLLLTMAVGIASDVKDMGHLSEEDNQTIEQNILKIEKILMNAGYVGMENKQIGKLATEQIVQCLNLLS